METKLASHQASEVNMRRGTELTGEGVGIEWKVVEEY